MNNSFYLINPLGKQRIYVPQEDSEHTECGVTEIHYRRSEWDHRWKVVSASFGHPCVEFLPSEGYVVRSRASKSWASQKNVPWKIAENE